MQGSVCLFNVLLSVYDAEIVQNSVKNKMTSVWLLYENAVVHENISH